MVNDALPDMLAGAIAMAALPVPSLPYSAPTMIEFARCRFAPSIGLKIKKRNYSHNPLFILKIIHFVDKNN